MGQPRVIATAPPRAGTAMAWRRNYGPQQISELAPIVAANAVATATYSQPATFAQALSPYVSRLYPTATLVTVAGNFWLESRRHRRGKPAAEPAEVERKRWQWEMRVDPFLDLSGQGATLTGMNRMRSGEALPLLCIGMDTPGTDATTFSTGGADGHPLTRRDARPSPHRKARGQHGISEARPRRGHDDERRHRRANAQPDRDDGFIRFQDVLSNGDTCYAMVVDRTTGVFQGGLYSYNAGTLRLSRTQIELDRQRDQLRVRHRGCLHVHPGHGVDR